MATKGSTDMIIVLGIGGGLIIIWLTVKMVKQLFNPNYSHGSSKWLSWWKKRQIVNLRHDGYVINGLDRISHDLSTKNIITIAPTGSGKTQGQVIPNIIRMNEYSIVCTDPSGEVCKQTAGALEKAGISIMIFRPLDPDNTMHYNPIQHVRSLSDAKMVANTIMAQMDNGVGDKFWIKAPEMLITALIHLLKDMSDTSGTNSLNMANVLKLLALPFKDLCHQIDEHGTEKTTIEFAAYRDSAEATRGSILSSALSALSLFSDELIQSTTTNHTINFDELRCKKAVFYLIIPEDKLPYCKTLMALFYTQLFSFLFTHTDGLPVYLLLDEFGNMKIPDFDTIITQSRKKRLCISIMLQSLDQLKARYRDGYMTIFEGGCQTKIFYSGMGLNNCKILSETIGDKTERYKEMNKHDPSRTTRISRRLITPDEIRTMPKNQIVVLTENNKPMRLRITPAYEQRDATGFIHYSTKHPISIKGESNVIINEERKQSHNSPVTARETATSALCENE